MVYKLIITERSEELYDRLEENPFQFPECTDKYLKEKGYREAVITDMNYLAIYKVEKNNIYVMGIFHELENYKNKL